MARAPRRAPDTGSHTSAAARRRTRRRGTCRRRSRRSPRGRGRRCRGRAGQVQSARRDRTPRDAASRAPEEEAVMAAAGHQRPDRPDHCSARGRVPKRATAGRAAGRRHRFERCAAGAADRRDQGRSQRRGPGHRIHVRRAPVRHRRRRRHAETLGKPRPDTGADLRPRGPRRHRACRRRHPGRHRPQGRADHGVGPRTRHSPPRR